MKTNISYFINILKRCTSPEQLSLGKLVHAHIVNGAFDSIAFVGNALINMYGKCGSIVDARVVFDKMPVRNVVSWNVMISKYSQHGHIEEAFKLLQQMHQEGVQPNKITFISMLNANASQKAAPLGKVVHACIIHGGLELDVIVGNALVNMYGKCGYVNDAWKMFHKMRERDLISWNAMLAAYAQHGQHEKAVELFWQMQVEGVRPDKITFISILHVSASTASLAFCKLLHACIIDAGFESEVVVGNALVNVYGQIGKFDDAQRTFDQIFERDLVSWNVMIAAYAQQGCDKEAFGMLLQMQQENLRPDKFTFTNILNAFIRPESLALGKLVHANIVDRGFELDVVVGTAVLSMYGKCGHIENARKIFDMMARRNVVSWTGMIAGYFKHGKNDEAFRLFHQMQREGIKPDKITFITILNACASTEALPQAKLIHAHIVDRGLDSDIVIGNALINMYANCGDIDNACRIFALVPKRDVISWTSIICGFAITGQSDKVFRHFQHMQQEGVKPNIFTFISILNACDRMEAISLGKLVHAYIYVEGVELNIVVSNALINMYGNCGCIQDACRMFDKMPIHNVVSWTLMIAAYAKAEYRETAFKLLDQMLQAGVRPNKITFISMLNVCTGYEAFALGKLVHAHIINMGFEPDVVLGTALVNMYAKCGKINEARQVFDKMPERNVVSWNVIIAAYGQNGDPLRTFELFQQMQQEGIKPDKITFVTILNTYASPEAIILGKLVHAHIIDEGFELDASLALINMYGKCGKIEDARSIFNKMPKRDLLSCTAMIAVYAQHGHGQDALNLFQQMQKEGLKPDKITLISVLNACSHAGMVDEGLHYFNSMIHDLGITPTLEHYNCVVDLLGRAGQLDQAQDFVNSMPFQADDVTLMTLLGSCRIHGCIDRGNYTAQHALQLIPQSASTYVVLSNIYAAAGMWDDAGKVRELMAD